MRPIVIAVALLSGCAASSFVHPQRAFTAKPKESVMKRSNYSPLSPIGKQEYGIASPNSILSVRGGSSTKGTNTQLQLTTFDIGPFNKYNQILIACNALGFIISAATGSHLHLDLLGTGAFAIAAIPSGLTSDIPRVQLSAGCVSLWATKLASFLLFRVLQLKRDARLEDTLSTTSGAFYFWVLSLLWGVICALPHSLGVTSSQNVPLLQSPCSIAGGLLFLAGFLTETTADAQKWLFKKNNPGAFCNTGLWSISQHPNFCGNMMLWSGILLMNAPALIDPPPATPAAGFFMSSLQTIWRFKRVALAALSPLFMYTLFNGQASGSFSNTQELAKSKYGKNPVYVKYVETVPLLFPTPFKRGI